MGLVPRFTIGDIREKMEAVHQRVDAVIIGKLEYLGETGVAFARTLNTYQDQTGNLRASIGYLILHDGIVVRRAFAGAMPEGASAGESHARKVAAEFPQGYVLILVAGMAYAAAVESRGLDVLSSAQHMIEGMLPQMKAEIKRQLANVGPR